MIYPRNTRDISHFYNLPVCKLLWYLKVLNIGTSQLLRNIWAFSLFFWGGGGSWRMQLNTKRYPCVPKDTSKTHAHLRILMPSCTSYCVTASTYCPNCWWRIIKFFLVILLTFTGLFKISLLFELIELMTYVHTMELSLCHHWLEIIQRLSQNINSNLRIMFLK